MKSSCFFKRLLAVCTLSLLTTASAWAFEGKIMMKMTGAKDQDSLPITYYVKGNKMRMETSVAPKRSEEGTGMTMAMLMDADAKQFITLMPEQKMYMTHKIPEVTGDKAGKAQEMNFKPTGRKEVILGYETEEYAGVSEGMETEVWVTKGLGKYMMANQGKGGGPGKTSAMESFLRQEDFFPLRTVLRKKGKTKEQMRMEVTQIDKTPQSDELFSIPKGYQQFSMGSMLKGMIPGADREN